MVYSAHSATVGRPGADGSEGDFKAHGNVQSLLEAFRPNGFDRRLSGLPKAARGAHRIVNGLGREGGTRSLSRFWKRPVGKTTPGVLLWKTAMTGTGSRARRRSSSGLPQRSIDATDEAGARKRARCLSRPQRRGHDRAARDRNASAARASAGGRSDQRRRCRDGSGGWQSCARRLEVSRSSTPSSRVDRRHVSVDSPGRRLDPSRSAHHRRIAAPISFATASPSSSAPKPSPITITSTRSTFPAIIRRAKASIRSGSPIRCCFARTRRRCRFERCKRHRPPIAIVAPGKCFRRDAVDARHLFQFHQVEGLLVAEDIHFGHLKGMLDRTVPRALRRRAKRALSPFVLSVHRTERRSRHDVPEMRAASGRDLQYVRRLGVDRARRRGHGPSQRASRSRVRSRSLLRMGLWLWRRALGLGPLRRRRHPPVRQERSRLSRAAELTRRAPCAYR